MYASKEEPPFTPLPFSHLLPEREFIFYPPFLLLRPTDPILYHALFAGPPALGLGGRAARGSQDHPAPAHDTGGPHGPTGTVRLQFNVIAKSCGKCHQVAALRWRALFNRAKATQLNFRVLYEALRNLEERWERDILLPAEVSGWKANSHSSFVGAEGKVHHLLKPCLGRSCLWGERT